MTAWSPELLGQIAPVFGELPIHTSTTVDPRTIYRMPDLAGGDRIVMHPDTLASLERALFLRSIRDLIYDGLTRAFPWLQVSPR